MLSEYIDDVVAVITNDGRQLVGTVRGVDQTTNLILADCHERVYSEEGVEQVALGLFIVRGDNVAVVGRVDAERDARIDFSLVRAEPLKPVVH